MSDTEKNYDELNKLFLDPESTRAIAYLQSMKYSPDTVRLAYIILGAKA